MGKLIPLRCVNARGTEGSGLFRARAKRARGGKQKRGMAAIAVLLVVLVCLLGTVFPQVRSLVFWDGLPWASMGGAAPELGEDAPLEWDESVAPNYYLVTGPAELTSRPDAGVVEYGSLDALGRATGVVACVDAPLAEQGASRERQNLSNVNPSGWGSNAKVEIELPNGKTYKGYFWNRSHLLAKSLGGSDELENLVCGTRMQNVGANVRGSEGGMAYSETLARNWLDKNPDGYVYYAATPFYVGNELVCRYVLVDVLSSDGQIDCRVVVYNAAKGYTIDYANGNFSQ